MGARSTCSASKPEKRWLLKAAAGTDEVPGCAFCIFHCWEHRPPGGSHWQGSRWHCVTWRNTWLQGAWWPLLTSFQWGTPRAIYYSHWDPFAGNPELAKAQGPAGAPAASGLAWLLSAAPLDSGKIPKLMYNQIIIYWQSGPLVLSSLGQR